MTFNRLISDAELCAFLDGELPESRAADVARAAKTQPHVQSQLKIWRAQDQWIKRHFAKLADEPVPDFFLQAVPHHRAPSFPHDVRRQTPPKCPCDETLFWKRMALTLGVLLFATALYASGMVHGTPFHAGMTQSQPKSLRGS